MHDHDDELERLARSRAEADRLYNEALTAVDAAAAAPRPDLPRPTANVDEQQLRPLNESWRLLPDESIDLGAGWRRRLRGFVWRLVGPLLQRQQQFNGLLVEHLNRNAQTAAGNRDSGAAFAAALDRRLETLAEFQRQLVRYLQQITLYVDTRDRHEAGQARRSTAEVRALADGLGAALNAVTDEFRKRLESAEIRDGRFRGRLEAVEVRDGRFGERLEAVEVRDQRAAQELRDLRQSVELVTAATHALKRARLRETPPAAGPQAADPGAVQVSGPPFRVAGQDTASGPAPQPVATAPQVAGRSAGAGQDTPAAGPAPAAAPDLDTYQYLCFEDAFRGSREEIAERQREYLPYFEGASDVLDLGCGRGEFLALLRERGVTARGLDANAEAVERCREQDLDAVRGDALQYLAGLADASLGGLFSAQVVEHLEAAYLTRLLAEAQRVLRPGSRIVLETINPASWTAFFSAFVRDVTHRHPLHPDTLSYLLRAGGFVDVEVAYRTPVPEEARLQRAAVDAAPEDTPAGIAVRALAETFNRHVDRLNGLMFAEQDYAAIAKRP